jgi:glutathione S-transferase
MYKLFVIPGSHACRSAMLMLEHKGLSYRRVDIVTLTHPVMVRLHGFDAGGQTRSAGGRRTLGLRMGDWLGTVPALAANGDRISTNYGIARYLDERHPQPALFPANPAQRAKVEEAEQWANQTLQMAARRVLGTWVVREPAVAARLAGGGRLGYLLYKREAVRRVIFPKLLARVFVSGPAREREVLEELPPMLDRFDSWISEGLLGGTELNAADFMVATSLALILYRPDVRPMFEGRPALDLVDRLLPEPAPRS